MVEFWQFRGCLLSVVLYIYKLRVECNYNVQNTQSVHISEYSVQSEPYLTVPHLEQRTASQQMIPHILCQIILTLHELVDAVK